MLRMQGLKHFYSQLIVASALLTITTFDFISFAVELDHPPKAKEQSAIIAGTPSTPGDQPWMAALLRKTSNPDIERSRRQFCGGSLIAPEWILTAAHCTVSSSKDTIEVVIGVSNLDEEESEAFGVLEIVEFPYFRGVNSNGGDLALLKLSSPSSNEVIPLYTEVLGTVLGGRKATVMGWGQTESTVDPVCEFAFADPNFDDSGYKCETRTFGASESEPVLLQTEQTMLTDFDCGARLIDYLDSVDVDTTGLEPRDFFSLISGRICAHDEAEVSAPCFGDSGGPLILYNEGAPTLVGIASSGTSSDQCAAPLSIRYFTDVAFFQEYIAEVMERDFSLTFDKYCPGPTTPQVTISDGADGVFKTRISWDAVEGATNYQLRFSDYPIPGDDIGLAELSGDSTEINVELKSGQNFFITLQAENENCSGPTSRLVPVVIS